MPQKILWLVIGWLWLIFPVVAWTPTAASTPTPTVSPSSTPASAQPEPTVNPRSGRFDEVAQHYSPDGQWLAVVNKTTGSLVLVDLGRRHQDHSIFSESSGVNSVTWSPDSRRLLVVRPYYTIAPRPGGPILNARPIEIWQVRLENRQVTTPTLLFQSSREAFQRDGPQQVVFGHWSPDNRYVIIWVSLLSASILADGLPPQVLDTETGQVYSVALDSSTGSDSQDLSRNNTALVNPRYQSWSPDSSKLAITAGGYRSAQINKWLNLFDVTIGQVTTVISQTEQVLGVVAWSPQGDWIAYAAVPAGQTGAEWADWMAFDNPAIAGRRVYLLDPATGQHRRLNNVESYQDAPVWSPDGLHLYYVQQNGKALDLMVADPATGQARPVPGACQPVDLNDPLRPTAGYYGQFGREELLEQIPEPPPGATVTGRIIVGYGSHGPLSDLPLWVGNEPDEEIKRRTAANGTFTLSGLQPGLTRIRNSHLAFEVPVTAITDTIDLGLLKYPLIHPPNYSWWTAAPLPERSSLLDQGETIDFDVCHTEPTWPRPARPVQQTTVWSKRPFSERSQAWLDWWFDRPAVLYNSEDLFEQSYPDGPNLDLLTADWRYLLGLWTDTKFEFEPGLADVDLQVPRTGCVYSRHTLDDLHSRRLLEVWLLGYRATEVRHLDKEIIDYDEAALCDPQEQTCTERPGHHFAVRVIPSPGYQIIRFPGKEDVLAVHLVDAQGRELATLPELQPDRWIQ